MASKNECIDFKPIPSPDGNGHTTLSIYPPGAWMGEDSFHCFVGGCGIGTKTTLAAAKRHLHKEALAYCQHQIDEAAKKLEHYETESTRLSTWGLGRPIVMTMSWTRSGKRRLTIKRLTGGK